MLSLLVGCNNDSSTNPENQSYDSFDDLDIPDNFNYVTTNTIELDIWSGLKSTVVITDNEGTEYFSSLTSDTGNMSRTITIPSTVSELRFNYLDEDYSYAINPSTSTLEVDLYTVLEDDEKGPSYNRHRSRVIPILEGIIHEDDGTITAHWGYNNQHSTTKSESIGGKNKFSGRGLTAPDDDQGQPTTFLPGRQVDVFNMNFTPDGNHEIKWKVDIGGKVEAKAKASSPEMPEIDNDGDGVIDEDDTYPNDEYRAYDVFYPSEDTYGTLAYEDLWPALGDYDFNDLVVKYNFKEVHNAYNEVVDIIGSLKLVAIGASKQNGFFIQLPFFVEDVTLVESNIEGAAISMEIISYDELAILQVFNNSNDVIQLNGDFMNTVEAEQTYPEVEMTFTINVSNSDEISDLLFTAPYNPYITIDHDITREVHLPGLPPTMSADTSIFGSADDATDIDNGYYYKTAEGIPWALNVSTSIAHSIEHADIIKAYPNFIQWVQSNGTNNLDWFNFPVNEKIYKNLNK